MQPLETLQNEHGLMRQYLDSLALAAEKLDSGQRPPKEFFENAVQFAKVFADKFHHVKEEHMMFVRLAQKKSGELDGQIQALRAQHEQGRDYITKISSDLDGYASGQAAQADRIKENLSAYVTMLRDHVHKEDHVFFPLVSEVLTDDEISMLKTEFDRTSEKVGPKTFEENHKLVVDMGSMLVHM